MATKGSQLKIEVANKILETFPGSFLYNDGKEIRIIGKENGLEIQLKCTLTCAKENVIPNSENSIPGEVNKEINFSDNDTIVKEEVNIEPTQEEKDNVKKMMEVLGL